MTLEKWFEFLPPGLREKALQNARDKGNINEVAETMYNAIMGLGWCKSPEGESYWAEIYNLMKQAKDFKGGDYVTPIEDEGEVKVGRTYRVEYTEGEEYMSVDDCEDRDYYVLRYNYRKSDESEFKKVPVAKPEVYVGFSFSHSGTIYTVTNIRGTEADLSFNGGATATVEVWNIVHNLKNGAYTPVTSFKVGDKVKISPSSEYYGDGGTNPKDVVGTLSEIRTDREYVYRVIWSSGATNVYKREDLVLAVGEIVSNPKFKPGDHVRVCSREEDKKGIGWLPSFHKAKPVPINKIGGEEGSIVDLLKTPYGTYYQISWIKDGYIHEDCLSLLSNIKSKQNGTEEHNNSSKGSAKVQRPHQQVSIAARIRGVGLKGTGSKIRLGGDHRHH